MRKMLLAVFLLLPAPLFAGPPERVSAKMVLGSSGHAVTNGLRQQRTYEGRIHWLDTMAPTGDPRIAVALGRELEGDDTSSDIDVVVVRVIARNYIRKPMSDVQKVHAAYKWWNKNKTDLRRRAKLLPE